MRVTKVESFPITLALTQPIQMSHITISESHNVLVKVTTDDGIVGWGEGVLAARLTGETQGRILASIGYLAPMIVGQDPLRRTALWNTMMGAVYGNRTAIGAIDIALFDIAGKAHGLPVYELIGGKSRDIVPSMTLLGSGDPAADAKEAAERYDSGFRWFKLKLGLSDPDTEVETFAAMADAVGDDAVLCGDANEAWTEMEAIRFINRLEGLPVRFIEQPIAGGDPAALVRVAERVPIGVCADEGIQSLSDIIGYGPTPVAGVSLKLIKLGGITGVMRGAHLCEAHRLHINLAGKVAESTIASAANVHAAAAIRELHFGVSPANKGIAADVSQDPLQLVDGNFVVPTGPGLGIDVDEDLVAKLGST